MDKPRIVNYPLPTCEAELPLGPSAEAGVITEGNAGWRVRRPVLDADKCVGCLICWVNCPDGVIDKQLHIDLDFCKGCGLCARECPRQAIEMREEELCHD